jgi:predicted methyltransferase
MRLKRALHANRRATPAKGGAIMRIRRISFPAILACAMLLAAVTHAFSAQQEKDTAAEAGATYESTVAPGKIPKPILDAVNSPDRPAVDRALDGSRKPEQTLEFFGIEPGMKVADLWAGGGYMTELLARVVGPDGKVYSQNGKFPPKFQKAEDAWKARAKKPGLGNIVELEEPFDDPSGILPVPSGSLDAVITEMNYHDLVGRGYDLGKINAAVFNALKPGGVYGIIDNSAQPGSGVRDISTLHRIDEAFAVKQIEKAGFKLQAASDVLRNSKDDRTWLVFQHRGEQDRFVLKFIKPQGAGGVSARAS